MVALLARDAFPAQYCCWAAERIARQACSRWGNSAEQQMPTNLETLRPCTLVLMLPKADFAQVLISASAIDKSTVRVNGADDAHSITAVA